MRAPPPRLHVPHPLAPGARLALPERAVRHVQVLRLQPGAEVRLFDGTRAEEWPARIERIGKRDVDVALGPAAEPVDREAALAVVLAVGMPANDRMDTLVEKATELGAAGIVPLATARSVLRLEGARAEARQRHWQAIAEAACEQCGRAVVPRVATPTALAAFLREPGDRSSRGDGARVVLSLAADAPAAADAEALRGDGPVAVLSGPEGGLAPEEEAAARAAGFVPVSLGRRTLRADTAPLAVLAWLGLRGATT